MTKSKSFADIEKKRKKKYKKKFKIKIVNFGCFKLNYVLCACGEEIIAYEILKEIECEKCQTTYLNEDVLEMGRLGM